MVGNGSFCTDIYSDAIFSEHSCGKCRRKPDGRYRNKLCDSGREYTGADNGQYSCEIKNYWKLATKRNIFVSIKTKWWTKSDAEDFESSDNRNKERCISNSVWKAGGVQIYDQPGGWWWKKLDIWPVRVFPGSLYYEKWADR